MSTLFHLYSREKQIKFEHITLEDGLSDSTIYCVFQDSRGFLWFGTDHGLDKYDGYNFKTYRHQPENPNSLGGNIVRAVVEDQSGTLWIGTFGGGLDKFDPKKEQFTHYQKVPGNPDTDGRTGRHPTGVRRVQLRHRSPSSDPRLSRVRPRELDRPGGLVEIKVTARIPG